MSDFVRQQNNTCDFKTSDSWVILSPIEQSIKRKIEAVGTPLKDWDIQINYGIKTGYNEAFIIKSDKRDEILHSCADYDEAHPIVSEYINSEGVRCPNLEIPDFYDPIGETARTAALIRPILRGRDIKRYGYNWANLWLINTHNGVKGKYPPIDINDYPAIKQHLDLYWDKISKRDDKGVTPYNLRNCAYLEDFKKPKIIYPNMTKYMPFVLDSEMFVTNQKCFIITGQNTAFLTAFLNSSLFKFCFRDSFPELQGGTRELSKIFFDKIPVMKVGIKTEQQFKTVVDNIQQTYTKQRAIEVDTLIFDLYKLSDEERNLVGFIEIQ